MSILALPYAPQGNALLVVALSVLLTISVFASVASGAHIRASENERADRTPAQFYRVIHEIQSTIEANNQIADLEEAYFQGESYQPTYFSDTGVRTRDLRGFELQREILRIRLSL
ncbi:hypothetical protein [Marinobacterium lutimaris]|uniref:Uncharacterized protein n=1 Tax=Marinobacterium lutimaris TaxID=568106 RepID=A0A1H5W718_9GAMM|nr:hypothetical protein [Marinobacterium lutimaris]SEF95138.1 hypothetical protein SAMN05444390_101956 [Marinobacterium lutimaris]